MKDVKELVNEYLAEAKLMQLATAQDGKPWVCTVWYVHDTDMNMYWESKKIRRHSKELAKNALVAGAICLPHIKGRGEKVRGLQFEGVAEIAIGEDLQTAWKLYKNKYTLISPTPLEVLEKSDADVAFYKLTPTSFVLFDEINFPNNPRQELSLY